MTKISKFYPQFADAEKTENSRLRELMDKMAKTSKIQRARWTAVNYSCNTIQEAVNIRKSWTVLQSYGKGNYQLVTPSTALLDLRNTNQKETRGTLWRSTG